MEELALECFAERGANDDTTAGRGLPTGVAAGHRARRKAQARRSSLGLDVRPEAMGLTWDQLEEGLKEMRGYVNSVGLWHSIAHDTTITPGFVSDLKRELTQAYSHKLD